MVHATNKQSDPNIYTSNINKSFMLHSYHDAYENYIFAYIKEKKVLKPNLILRTDILVTPGQSVFNLKFLPFFLMN